MYRVKVTDASVRSDLLSNSFSLKNNADFRNVFLFRDLTDTQRHEQKAARTTKRNQISSTQ